MSRYCGKCDFGDTCEIVGVEKILSCYEVYSGRNIVPLKFETEKDLLPYYPFLVSAQIWSDGKGRIELTTKSYVDICEEEHLSTLLNDGLRYYKSCKRRKVPFDVDECIKKSALFPADYNREIAERIAADGLKANTEGIHVPIYDTERRWLYEDMVKAGWDEVKAYEWCFGWERLLKRWHDEHH